MKDYVVDGKVVRIELDNGKKVTAATEFLQKMMKNLEIDMDEAVMTWLEDEEYLINDDQEKLCVAAKENHSLADARKGNRAVAAKKVVKTVKENPVKEMIISTLAKTVESIEGAENVIIENKGKIITFRIGEEEYKIDLVQKRKKKDK